MSTDLYHVALFLHIVFAIALVGGSVWAHVTASLLPRAGSIEGIRSHVRFLAAISKSGGPLAMLVLIPGLYMAFSGGHWGAGWPGVALVLFAATGGLAFRVLEPGVQRVQAVLDETPDGPITPEVGAKLANPKLTMATWLMAGMDLAIVYLMTNKPGLVGSVVVGVLGIAAGAVVGMRETRAHAAPPAPAAPAA